MSVKSFKTIKATTTPRGHCPDCGDQYRHIKKDFRFSICNDGTLHSHAGCLGKKLYPLGVLLHGEGTQARSKGCECRECSYVPPFYFPSSAATDC